MYTDTDNVRRIKKYKNFCIYTKIKTFDQLTFYNYYKNSKEKKRGKGVNETSKIIKIMQYLL